PSPPTISPPTPPASPRGSWRMRRHLPSRSGTHTRLIRNLPDGRGALLSRTGRGYGTLVCEADLGGVGEGLWERAGGVEGSEASPGGRFVPLLARSITPHQAQLGSASRPQVSLS